MSIFKQKAKKLSVEEVLTILGLAAGCGLTSKLGSYGGDQIIRLWDKNHGPVAININLPEKAASNIDYDALREMLEGAYEDDDEEDDEEDDDEDEIIEEQPPKMKPKSKK